jgi:hypothetical protein
MKALKLSNSQHMALVDDKFPLANAKWSLLALVFLPRSIEECEAAPFGITRQPCIPKERSRALAGVALEGRHLCST